MPSYNSTARRPFKTGGTVKRLRDDRQVYTGPPPRKNKKKKETRKDKKKRKRKELSKQVSRETFHEAIKDIWGTKGKVHSLKSSRQDAADRINKLHKKQQYFYPEKELKEGFGEVRDKGWGGKHSQKKPEHN